MTEKNGGDGPIKVDFGNRKMTGDDGVVEEVKALLSDPIVSPETPALSAKLEMVGAIVKTPDSPVLPRQESIDSLANDSLEDIVRIIMQATENECKKDPGYYVAVYEAYLDRIKLGDVVKSEWVEDVGDDVE